MYTPMTSTTESHRIRNERENMEWQAHMRALAPNKSGRTMAFLSKLRLPSLPRRRDPEAVLPAKSLAEHA